MNRWQITSMFGAAAIVCAMLGAHARVDSPTEVQFTEAEIKRILQHELPAVPEDPTNKYANDLAAAHFGQFLFFEKRLSRNGEVSCATCHDPQKGFADGKQLASGIGQLNRHTMSLWNTAYNRWYFWDGRADTQWMQALEPFEHALEYGSSRATVVKTIYEDAQLRRGYEVAFGPMPASSLADSDTIDRTYVNIGKAVAAYERKLISRDSPFDVFLDGLKTNNQTKLGAMNPAAQRGLKLFIGAANCRLCHAGPNFTDGEFHNTGIPSLANSPPDKARYEGVAKLLSSKFNASGVFSDDSQSQTAENVRLLVNSPENWGQFKTPGLRNIAQTAPYMHQGQFADLSQVIHFYSTLEGAVPIGHHQETTLVPLQLSLEQQRDLESFLRSLTGKPLDSSLLTQPEHPFLPD